MSSGHDVGPGESRDRQVVFVESLSVIAGEAVILDGISLGISPCEVVAAIRPNRAGTTPLLKTILDLAPVTSGQVRLFGMSFSQLGPERDRLAYVPQILELDRSFPIPVREL